MVRDDLLITVPIFFKCPISLDVMKSPVSLCTGVTYDRASIQKWLDNGNNTCPATMQSLRTKDFTPNHTLQRLIHMWESESNSTHPSLLKLLQSLNQTTSSTPKTKIVDSLTKLADFLQTPDSETKKKNQAFLVNAGCIPVLIGLLSRNENLQIAESIVRVLRLVLTDYADIQETLKSTVVSIDPNALLLVLQKGSVDSRIDAARVLEALISTHGDVSIAEREGVLPELFRLMSSDADLNAIDAGLSCLIAVSTRRKIRSRIVRLGSVPVLGRLLERSYSNPIAEKVLKMLETLSTCSEGRIAICEDPICVPAIIQRMLKVSNSATERAVVVLWSVCHLFRDQRAQDAVGKSNGLTKILLVMQSGCSQGVRQMCGDLVKIFRVNSKSCLFSYDTKTTHIMPF